MKLKFICLLFLFFFISCDDTSWKENIDDLQEQINANKSLIEALNENLFITRVDLKNTEYKIYFSDGTSLTIKNGYVPLIKIGKNGNWYVDNVDTGQKAQGNTPTITIGVNGNWFIDNVDTGQKAQGSTPIISIGEDGNWYINGVNTDQTSQGTNTPFIVNIVETNDQLVFHFSDGSSITVPRDHTPKKIVCWGNSLTVGAGGNGTTFPLILQLNMGDTYHVINAGASGEDSYHIAARQGGIPMYIDKDYENIIKGVPFVIGNYKNSGMRSSGYPPKNITPLLQGGGETINNCTIDGNDYELKWSGTIYDYDIGEYTLTLLNENHSPATIKQGAIVFTSSMKRYRNVYANVFFIGQNGGFENNADLINQIKKMVEFSGSSNYVVIGLHARGTKEEMIGLESDMIKEFGSRFINLRKYFVEKAFNDTDLEPTQEDRRAIENGLCPPQFLVDGLHFNAIGYTLIGNLISERFVLLGI